MHHSSLAKEKKKKTKKKKKEWHLRLLFLSFPIIVHLVWGERNAVIVVYILFYYFFFFPPIRIFISSSDSHWCISFSLPLYFGRFPNCVSFLLYYFFPPTIRSIDYPPPLHLAKTQKRHIYRKQNKKKTGRMKVNWLWLISMFNTHTLHNTHTNTNNHFTVSTHCVFCIIGLLSLFTLLIGLLRVTDWRVRRNPCVSFRSIYLSPSPIFFYIPWTRK